MAYPDIMHIPPNRRRHFALAATSLFMTGVGFLQARFATDHEIELWLFFYVMVLAFLFFVVVLVTGAGGVVLMKEGFGMRRLFRTKFFEWTQVGVFTVTTLEVETHGVTARDYYIEFDNSVENSHCSVPRMLKYSPQHVARIMNAYREAALVDLGILPSGSQDDFG